MAELLTVAAIMFSGRETQIHCVQPWTGPTDWYAYVIDYDEYVDMFLRGSTCRDLRRPRPTWENIETFTHELIHARFPYVNHGRQMDRAIMRFYRQVCRLLNVRCPRPTWQLAPQPEPAPIVRGKR